MFASSVCPSRHSFHHSSVCEAARGEKIARATLGVAVATREASLFVVSIGAASFPGPVTNERGEVGATVHGDEYNIRDVGERFAGD